MRDQIQELLGTQSLNKTTQAKVKNAYGKLLKENFNPDDSIQMRVLLHAIGVHRLKEATQIDLREKISMIVECERHKAPYSKDQFKWNSNSESPAMFNEVKKDVYQWDKNEGSVLTDGTAEKIKKSQFRWGADSNSIGSGIKGATT